MRVPHIEQVFTPCWFLTFRSGHFEHKETNGSLQHQTCGIPVQTKSVPLEKCEYYYKKAFLNRFATAQKVQIKICWMCSLRTIVVPDGGNYYRVTL